MSTPKRTLQAVPTQAATGSTQTTRTALEPSLLGAVSLAEHLEELAWTLWSVRYNYMGEDEAQCRLLRSLLADDLEQSTKELTRDLRILKQREEPERPAPAAA